MRRIFLALVVVGVCIAAALVAPAQRVENPTPQRISPHETISTVVDGSNRIIIVYGRPYSKNPRGSDIRKIWGTLVPWDKVWRTGADEATLLICQQPIVMGGTTVPAGAYTLFSLPKEDGSCKLIISKDLGEWGLNYDEKKDLARVDMKKDSLDKQVDQFTMVIEANPVASGGGGTIRMMWENAQYSLAFTTAK